MGVSTVRDITAVAPLGHAEAMVLARTEYERFADLLDELDTDDWAAPTCCPGWTVRDMAGHVLGSMRSSASGREQRRQLRAAKQHPGPVADGLTVVQVAATAGLSAEEVRREIRASIEAAVQGRRRVPALLRRLVPIRSELPVSGALDRWTLGYLVDTVLTRDVWMHRSDLAEAVGRPFLTDAEHDGRLVALVVADWAGRHGRGVRLVLGGACGGTFLQGGGGPEVASEAVAFCRALSGRDGAVPFDTEVPF